MGTGLRFGRSNPTVYSDENMISGVEDQVNILVVHQNRNIRTSTDHRFADLLDGHQEINVIVDKKVWKRGEKTSKTEINKREKSMVEKADLIVRIIHPSTKTGPRHEGPQREERKAIYRVKPILRIYAGGARDSPNRPKSEKKYYKMIEIHLKPYQQIYKGFKKGYKKLRAKRLIKKKLDL